MRATDVICNNNYEDFWRGAKRQWIICASEALSNELLALRSPLCGFGGQATIRIFSGFYVNFRPGQHL